MKRLSKWLCGECNTWVPIEYLTHHHVKLKPLQIVEPVPQYVETETTVYQRQESDPVE